MRIAPLLLAVLGATACQDDPISTVVQSGTIGGVPFTVVRGTLHQSAENGPVLGDFGGAIIALDEDAAALGMTDSMRVHVRTTFALRNGGTIAFAAFGPQSDPLSPGTGVIIGRNNNEFDYVVYVDDAIVSDTMFVPAPTNADFEHTVVLEFYAENVPGYGPGSGLSMWPLNDTTPALGEDVIGCTIGPAMSTTPLTGDRVGFGLEQAFILSIEVVDTIVGPCI
jgi:hypothetical protein